MICSFPGCKNKVPESKGLKPRLFCDDIECKKKRHNLEAKRYRRSFKEKLEAVGIRNKIDNDGVIHYLYRHFDINDNLLYVGISLSIFERLACHKNRSSWFEQIRKITIEPYTSRVKCLTAEAEVIKKENPIHNKRISYVP